MTQLTVYRDDAPDLPVLQTADAGQIAALVETLGGRFERWPARRELAPGAAPEVVLTAYEDEIRALQQEGGYQTADVISLHGAPSNLAELRAKFLAEHTHAEDEVRFFVAGSGLFVLHAQGQVFALLCEKDDLISVPAGLQHWFDMGPSPSFTCIRLFTDPAGWAAQYTGDGIATRFPSLGDANGPSA
ncbi:MAG: cupin [Corticimicrobacter sp.]|uniref:1,2-dihydroxy-3-keto-5-methylthiopentene dioxygenase n=1 Tax=Corticimicrobacter sp. TaxID=2678536 RepID=UPI0032DA6D44